MRFIAAPMQANSSENAFNWQFLLTLFLVFVVFYLFRRMSRTAQVKQEEARQQWFTVGTNVVTTSGFLGTIVDIDGDAVTLESPSGDETVWVKAAIRQPMDIPLAQAVEEEGGDTASVDSAKTQGTATDSAVADKESSDNESSQS